MISVAWGKYNGLMANSRQTTTLFNVDNDLWRHMAPQGYDDFLPRIYYSCWNAISRIDMQEYDLYQGMF